MDYNYHTHTYRCGHATGTEEEYIHRAISGGIRYMGFSDHCPWQFSDGHETGYRVPTKLAEEYITTLRALRKKYADKLEIKIGFEMEYYPLYFSDMLSYVKKLGAEYLILGQHLIYNEYPNGENAWEPSAKRERLGEYVSCLVSAIKSGAFTYIAHPGIYTFLGEDSVYAEEMRKVCVASREYGVPLEINCLGIRDNRRYPFLPFWHIAAEEKSPVTIGFDAHDAMAAYDAESIPKAMKIIEDLKLNYIGRPDIITL